MKANQVETVKIISKEVYAELKEKAPNQKVSKASVRAKYNLNWVEAAMLFGNLSLLSDVVVQQRFIIVNVPVAASQSSV